MNDEQFEKFLNSIKEVPKVTRYCGTPYFGDVWEEVMDKETWELMIKQLKEMGDEEWQKFLDEYDEEYGEGNWEDEMDKWWEEYNNRFEEQNDEEWDNSLGDYDEDEWEKANRMYDEYDNMNDLWEDEPILKVKKLHKDAIIPKQATTGSACFDLYMPCDYTFVGNSKLVGIGLAFEIPEGHVMLVMPRSSTGLETPLRQSNSIGVIDSDYRGEVGVMFDIARGEYQYTVKKGESVAQAMILKLPEVSIIEVDELSETERGEGGFGSTGK